MLVTVGDVVTLVLYRTPQDRDADSLLILSLSRNGLDRQVLRSFVFLVVCCREACQALSCLGSRKAVMLEL